MTINLPSWMIMRIQKMYPELSTQAAIKHYLRDCLNNGSNYTNKQLEEDVKRQESNTPTFLHLSLNARLIP